MSSPASLNHGLVVSVRPCPAPCLADLCRTGSDRYECCGTKKCLGTLDAANNKYQTCCDEGGLQLLTWVSSQPSIHFPPWDASAQQQLWGRLALSHPCLPGRSSNKPACLATDVKSH